MLYEVITVSGVNATIAKNIVKYRDENGRFKSRKELQKVPRLGAKTYEQCIGFLRINDGSFELDRTPIHPESYEVVERLFAELSVEMEQLGSKELNSKLATLQPEAVAVQLEVGVPTLRDIIDIV